jgi:hypothetical protein
MTFYSNGLEKSAFFRSALGLREFCMVPILNYASELCEASSRQASYSSQAAREPQGMTIRSGG